MNKIKFDRVIESTKDETHQCVECGVWTNNYKKIIIKYIKNKKYKTTTVYICKECYNESRM